MGRFVKFRLLWRCDTYDVTAGGGGGVGAGLVSEDVNVVDGRDIDSLFRSLAVPNVVLSAVLTPVATGVTPELADVAGVNALTAVWPPGVFVGGGMLVCSSATVVLLVVGRAGVG
jgi:hypothetical protein